MTYRCLIENWERLLSAVRASEAESPALTPLRVDLEGELEAVKAAKVRQLSLLAASRSSTRELQQRIAAGLDKARRLRSQVKADLGPRDVRLGLFGIAPLGKRKPYAKPR